MSVFCWIPLKRALFLLCVPTFFFAMTEVWGQVTGGSVSGVISDSSGAILPETEVTLRELRTGRERSTETNSEGYYRFLSLLPGRYVVVVEKAEFIREEIPVLVNAGKNSMVPVSLEPGGPQQEVEVAGSPLRPDSVHHSLSAVLTAEDIRDYPMNGRNFLDTAQLLPGIELVDSTDLGLWPAGPADTKRGYTGLAIGGRTGRTTRITVDGIDISDEFGGTTRQNLSPDAIQELHVSYASMDPAISLTTQGAVNVVTQSGGRDFHGTGFFITRDSRLAALPVNRTGDAFADNVAENARFDRQHFGGSLGGPMLKEQLYFFLNYENLNQDGAEFIYSEVFPQWNGPKRVPFNGEMGLARLDWDPSESTRSFLRFTYDGSKGATGIGGAGMAPQQNTSVGTVAAGGFEWIKPNFIHSIRYGHSDFNTSVSGEIIDGLPLFTDSSDMPISLAEPFHLLTAPHLTVPQSTFQTNDQWKYDGFWTSGQHTLRFGGEINYIRANFFWSYYSEGPNVNFIYSEGERDRIVDRGGNPQDPLEYPISYVAMGNGLGYLTEIPNQGRPFGGINNTRLAGYFSDSWRLSPRLNLNLGLRYELDTGQVNNDLGLPASFSEILGSEGIRPTRLDTNNFAPQAGIAWQPFEDGKTVIRGGAGIFYETQLLMNTAIDRSVRLPPGIRHQIVYPPFFGLDSEGRVTVDGVPVNNVDTSSWIGSPIGLALDEIGQTFRDFQAATAAQEFDPDRPPLIELMGGTDEGFIFAQDYSTPFSIHTNIGFQHQLTRNWLVSTDFVRTRSHHNVLRSINNMFTSDTLNVPAAREWLDGLVSSQGLSSLDELLDQMLANGTPFWQLRMGLFFEGERPDTNIVLRTNDGRATYKALQIRAQGRVPTPFCCLHSMDLNLSYVLSRYTGNVGDQDAPFGRYRDDNGFSADISGPAGFDRTHQLNLFVRGEMPAGFTFTLNQRMRSPLSSSLRLAGSSFGADTLFYSDIDGDGSTFDLLPGTGKGSFGRDVNSPEELNALIQSFNEEYAGTFAPAARALIESGLFTEDQLRAFNVVIPPTQLAPADQAMNDSFITTDVRFGKRFTIGENVTIEPAVEVFNLFNVANYQPMDQRLLGWLGTANGTPRRNRPNRIGMGSGSFGQGLPRAFQLGVRMEF